MPSKLKKADPDSNVIRLDIKNIAPHPGRLRAMRQWHQARAASLDQDLAAIHISITADGSIKTEGICMEPVHAQALLEAVPRLVERLQFAAGIYLDEAPQTSGIQRRSGQRR
jgi:hypothetical protein